MVTAAGSAAALADRIPGDARTRAAAVGEAIAIGRGTIPTAPRPGVASPAWARRSPGTGYGDRGPRPPVLPAHRRLAPGPACAPGTFDVQLHADTHAPIPSPMSYELSYLDALE